MINELNLSGVSFNSAILLNKKGFDVYCEIFIELKSGEFQVCETDYKPEECCYLPTQEQAIEWIRINFRHDIEARGVRYAGDDKASYYQTYVNGNCINNSRYETPMLAKEAGILYTLNL